MGLLDYIRTSLWPKYDATLTFDPKRNRGTITIVVDRNMRIGTLKLELVKENDPEGWVSDSFIGHMTYTNSDDDMGGEYKNIDIDLIAGLPATVEFSMETISKYSKAEIQKSFEKLVEDTDIGPEEIDEYKTAFLDPKWTLDLYRDEKYFLTSIEFDYEDPEIVEYIHSLKI